jgi:Na+/H+ antiporter NhaA
MGSILFFFLEHEDACHHLDGWTLPSTSSLRISLTILELLDNGQGTTSGE